MPFSGPDDKDLPDRIQVMEKETREKWVSVWNASFKNCRDTSKAGGGGTVEDCEGTAFKFANAAVKGFSVKCYVEYYQPKADQETAEYSPTGGGTAKACANCLFFGSPDRCTVVDSYPFPIAPTGLSKFWTEVPVFQGEPIEVVIVEGASDKMVTWDEKIIMAEDTKQVTKTDGGIEFKASDYAVVPDAEKPSTWKLRLAEEKSGNFTVAQVARAITAMQPSGFRGQRVELTADDKAQATSRISAAIGKSGGDDTQKENLRERLDNIKEKGLVERVVEAVKNILSPKTPDPELSGFKLYKQADGTYRWFSWVSNHFRDKDNPPEIFEAKAHQEFIAYLDNGGEFPETWLWHTPGTKWGKADWADFVNGFLVMSGTVDADKESIARSLEAMEGLKVSHGFNYAYSNPEKGLIGWYRTFEISPLPAEVAANPWTGMEVLKKEADMGFETKKREFLVSHLGEDQVVALEGKTEEMAKALEGLGIEYKDAGESTEEGVANILIKNLTASDPQEVAQAAAKAVVESEGFKGILTTLAEVKAVTDKIPGILTDIEALKKTDDDKVANIIASAASKAAAGFQASAAEETKVKKGEGGEGPVLPDDWKELFVKQVVGAAPSSE